MDKTYRVKDGIEMIDGRRVPADRLMKLSDVAARHDLDHGNIEPVADVKTRAPKDPPPALAQVKPETNAGA